MKIAFFGTGLMGSGFVRRARANGHEVNVWNRSAGQGAGAGGARRAAPSTTRPRRWPASSASTCRWPTMPRSTRCWSRSPAAIPRPTAGSSTTPPPRCGRPPSASRAGTRAADLRARAGVHGAGQCAEGTGLMLVSGEKSRHDALLPALQQMTGNGALHGRGARACGGLQALRQPDADRHPGRARRRQPPGACGRHLRPTRPSRCSSSSTPGQMLPARAARIAAGDSPRPRSRSRWRARTCG